MTHVSDKWFVGFSNTVKGHAEKKSHLYPPFNLHHRYIGGLKISWETEFCRNLLSLYQEAYVHSHHLRFQLRQVLAVSDVATLGLKYLR